MTLHQLQQTARNNGSSIHLQGLEQPIRVTGKGIDQHNLKVRVSQDGMRAVACYLTEKTLPPQSLSGQLRRRKPSVMACWHKEYRLGNLTPKEDTPDQHLVQLAFHHLSWGSQLTLLRPGLIPTTNQLLRIKEVVEKHYLIHLLYLNSSGEICLHHGINYFPSTIQHLGWIYAPRKEWAALRLFLTEGRRHAAFDHFKSEVEAYNLELANRRTGLHTLFLKNEGSVESPYWQMADDGGDLKDADEELSGLVAKSMVARLLARRMEAALDWLEPQQCDREEHRGEARFGL